METGTLDETEPPALPGSGESASPLMVLVLAAGIVILTLAALGLAFPKGGTVEPAALLDEVFATTSPELAYGLVPKEALQLPSGDRLLRFEPSEVASEEDQNAVHSLTLLVVPNARGAEVIRDQFKSLRFESGDKGGFGGGGRRRGRGGRGGGGRGGGYGGGSDGDSKPKLQDAGHLDWFGFDATFARLRHSLPKGETEATNDDGDGDPEDPASEDGADSDGPRADDTVADDTDADDTGSGESTDDAGTEDEAGEAEVDSREEDPEEDPGEDEDEDTPFYETLRINLSTDGRCVIAYIRLNDGVVGTRDMAEAVLEGLKPRD